MMNLSLTTGCNVRRKESRQPGRQKSVTQVLFRPERMVINAQWLCPLRTLPVLFLALWILVPFFGHGLLDDFPPNFCLTFAVPCPCLLQIYGIPPTSFRLFHGPPSCGISVHQYLGDTQVPSIITTWPARCSLLCQYNGKKWFVGIPGPSLHWFCDV